MATFDIQIVSDVVCPWCYIGKKRLERAIDLYKKTVSPQATFAVTWHPFYLDPTAPQRGVPVLERVAEKFGADRVGPLMQRLDAVGLAEGIRFTHEGKTGNTRDAHRLVQLAKARGGAEAQGRVMASLFRSYFEEGGDVTSADSLVAAAERAGLDGAEARRWLEAGGGGAEVDAEVETAYRAGVHGVPSFTVNGRYKVEGAQDAQTFLEVFVAAKDAADKAAGKQETGFSC